MNVSLTEKQKAYISSQIEMGDYQNASELVRDALRLHQLYRMKTLEDLQKAIAKAWDGETSSRSATEIAMAKRADLLGQ